MALSEKTAKKINTAVTSDNSDNIRDGEYVLLVQKIELGGRHENYIIPTFTVLSAEPDPDFPDRAPNKVGSTCSCKWDAEASGDKGDAIAGHIKSFFSQLVGDKPYGDFVGKKGEEDSLRARGMVIHAKTFHKAVARGDNKGQDRVYPRFTRLEQTEAEALERRKQLDDAEKK